MPIDPERIVSDWHEDWYEAEMNRPLGPAEMATNAALSPFSRALWVCADNLLDKAVRALRAGDADRAVALVHRAASLPFDDHEGSAPAALAAHMQLFSRVIHVLEECEEGDERWLDPAVDLLRSASLAARQDVRDVLAAIDHDYDLTPTEHRRIRTDVHEVPPAPELRDQVELTEPELAERVMAVLSACVDYEDALARRSI